MTVVEKLFELGCTRESMDYLGDGVYVGTAGSTVWLVVERENDFHYIAMGSSEYKNFRDYLNRQFRTEPLPEDSRDNFLSEPGEHQVVLDAIRDC